jgi:pimeloyl-ACP methyl ester carboxylesterase
MASFERGGLRFAYEERGAGLPLILHIGAGGDSRLWVDAGYLDGLSQFRVILFDHRGHGASSVPSDPSGLRICDSAADVLALADHLGLERFAFWGYSYGARVGFELASSQPDRVSCLVATGGVDAPGGDSEEWRAEAALVRADGLEAIMPPRPDVPSWLYADLYAADRRVVASEFAAIADWSPWPLFPRIVAPTLIVAGEAEASTIETAAAQIRHGRAVTLSGLDHISAFLASDRVLAHVVPFLSDACTARAT